MYPKSYNDNYSFYYNRKYNRTRINCFAGTFLANDKSNEVNEEHK